MKEEYEAAFNEAVAEFEEQRDSFLQMQEDFDQITGSARSKRRQVSVTVDANGDIIELKFHGQGYRNLPPAELADIIVQTFREARREAQAQVSESVSDLLPPGVELEDLTNIDWAEAFSGAMTLPEPLLDLLSRPPTVPSMPEGVDLSELFGKLGAVQGTGATDRTEPVAERSGPDWTRENQTGLDTEKSDRTGP